MKPKISFGAILKEYTVLFLLIVMIVFFSVTVKGFATMNNAINLLKQIAVLGIITPGMAILLISGNLDLSMGAQMGLVGCIVAMMIKADIPIVLCLLAGIALAFTVSLLNGIVVLKTGMPAMICTLAMMQIVNGITYTITKAGPIYGLPESVKFLGQGFLFGIIPMPVVIMFAVLLVAGFILGRTYIGRYLFAVGCNPEASRLSGVPVSRIKLYAYIISGIFVGIGGIVLMARLNSGQPTAGEGMEMDVITACVVGGIAFTGGKGKIGGIVQGVLIMGLISNGFGVMGMSVYNQMIIKGIILMTVVGIDSYQQIKASMQKMRIVSSGAEKSGAPEAAQEDEK